MEKLEIPDDPAIRRMVDEVVAACKAVIFDRDQLRGDYVSLALATLVLKNQ